MKKLIFLILLIGCGIEIKAGPFKECYNGVDCAPGETCENHICVETFVPLQPGEKMVECKCWDSFIYVSEIIYTNRCSSGTGVVKMCVGCCEYWRTECVKPSLAIYCAR